MFFDSPHETPYVPPPTLPTTQIHEADLELQLVCELLSKPSVSKFLLDHGVLNQDLFKANQFLDMTDPNHRNNQRSPNSVLNGNFEIDPDNDHENPVLIHQLAQAAALADLDPSFTTFHPSAGFEVRGASQQVSERNHAESFQTHNSALLPYELAIGIQSILCPVVIPMTDVNKSIVMHIFPPAITAVDNDIIMSHILLDE
ncbi:hypothetical protein FRX31_029051, partial [Thalictrum thalictroides]